MDGSEDQTLEIGAKLEGVSVNIVFIHDFGKSVEGNRLVVIVVHPDVVLKRQKMPKAWDVVPVGVWAAVDMPEQLPDTLVFVGITEEGVVVQKNLLSAHPHLPVIPEKTQPGGLLKRRASENSNIIVIALHQQDSPVQPVDQPDELLHGKPRRKVPKVENSTVFRNGLVPIPDEHLVHRLQVRESFAVLPCIFTVEVGVGGEEHFVGSQCRQVLNLVAVGK